MISTQLDISTTIIPGWPDAIVCNGYIYTYHGGGRYYAHIAMHNTHVAFNDDGTYQSTTGDYAKQCLGQSIKQLYENGRAFNFITSPALKEENIRLNNELGQGKKKLDNEIKAREKEVSELREENRKLNEKIVQHEKQLEVAEYHNILYPSIMLSAALVGTKLGHTLFKGGAIGMLIGIAACTKYDDIADYATKLIGDAKHEDL